MHWWCWWRPGKLESIQPQMDNVQCAVLLRYTYRSVFSLDSNCLLIVVHLLFESASASCLWTKSKLLLNQAQTYRKYVNNRVYRFKKRRSIYWIPVLLEVYFQNMTEIKWHAPSAVICCIWVIFVLYCL